LILVPHELPVSTVSQTVCLTLLCLYITLGHQFYIIMNYAMIFSEFLHHSQQRVNNELERILPPDTLLPKRLHAAMRYATLNGGKRIRPALVYATGELLEAPTEMFNRAACAIELIHSYSLVHDDLPAMDNDTLRRGKPTCHIAFDEATAILVGDALQSLAFQCLAQTNLAMVNELALAAGSLGMVGGQQIDIENVGNKLDLSQLKQMHEYKTGALIVAAVRLGALASPQVTAEQLTALTTYANCIGLAFQVHDDILDAESTTEKLGKTAGSDAAHDKPTYTQLLGVEKAKVYEHELYEEAVDAVSVFESAGNQLPAIAEYAIRREY
jgi:geranylgeranyl pyrophosphate synthase